MNCFAPFTMYASSSRTARVRSAAASDPASGFFTSPEVEEYRRVCNRVLVFHGGDVVGELTGEEATETRIMEIAAGSQYGYEH